MKHSKSFRFLPYPIKKQREYSLVTPAQRNEDVKLLSNLTRDENRGLSPLSQTGFRAQLAAVPLTGLDHAVASEIQMV